MAASVDHRIPPDGSLYSVAAPFNPRSLELRNGSTVPVNILDSFGVPAFSLPANSQAIVTAPGRHFGLQAVGQGSGDILARLHADTIPTSGIVGPPITTTAALPTPPLGVKAVGGNQNAVVSWQAVAAAGLTGYNVRGNLRAPVQVGPGVTSVTITGLTNLIAYAFTVTALNQYGESASEGIALAIPLPSLPYSPIQDGFTLPAPPQNLSGRIPDSVPQGAAPTWQVLSTAHYQTAAGSQCGLISGSGAALINPGAAGNRTVAIAFKSTPGQVFYSYIFSDLAALNQLFVLFNATVGTPAFSLYQNVGGVTALISSFGPNYVSDTYTCWITAVVTGNSVAISCSAKGDGGGTLAGQATLGFWQALASQQYAGFLMTSANANPALWNVFCQDFVFTSP